MWESPLSKLQWNQNKDTSFLYQISKDSKKNENTIPWLELVVYLLSRTIAFYIEIWHCKEKCYDKTK